ncbi:hypothetical protein L9F63_001344 [Diploptera punctata]|uniref:Uncharacterized protein n=1 Tax=Diploptera punctata TaxID=6984 RepID=A0AAD8A488_DIPPU|nr:hypothetical protein L9F63_001344 [Diploptera punctata]
MAVSVPELDKNVSTCILSIVNTYFTKMLPVFIFIYFNNSSDTRQFPLNTSQIKLDLLHSFLKTLYYSEHWSLYVYSSTVEIEVRKNVSENINKPSGYVFFIDNEVSINFEEEILKLSSLPSWNPRGKFVVYTSQYTSKKTEEEILECFWKYKILEVIFMKNINDFYILETFLPPDILKHWENESRTIYAIGLYRWFPFLNSSRCSNEIFLQDVWISEGNGYFIFNKQLFGHKSELNFNRCLLSVSTYASHRVVLPPKQVNGILVFESGWEINLIQIIAGSLNASLYYIPHPIDFYYKTIYKNGTHVGIMADLIEYKADVAFAGLPVMDIMIQNGDPTTSYGKIKYGWLVPCSRPLPHWQSMFKIFTESLWISYIACIIVSAAISTLISKCLKRINVLGAEIYSKFASNVFNLFAISLGTISSSLPTVMVLRLFFIVWICYSFAFTTVIQTYLMSFLVEPFQEKQITSLEDMLNSGIEFGFEAKYDLFFNLIDTPKSRYVIKKRRNCSCSSCCLERLAYKRDFCTFYNLLRYRQKKYEYSNNDTGEIGICSVPRDFYTTNIAIFVPKGHFLLNHLNNIITRIIESGIYTKFEQDDDYYENRRILIMQNKSKSSGYIQLSLHHLIGAFYILLFGKLLSILIFLLEICADRTRAVKIILQ